MRSHPDATLAEARGHKPKPRVIPPPEDMVRNTWGTGFSNKNKPFSFTLYTFSKFDLDRLDQRKCEEFFSKLLEKWLREQYRNAKYTFAGDWWGTEIIRTEENMPVVFDKDFYLKYSFEVNHQEQKRGELAEIL